MTPETIPAYPTKAIFQAQPGDCLFDRAFVPTFSENDLPELLRKTEELHDDRLMSTVAALIIENRVNMLLAAFLPEFRLISKNIDFTASMRSTILESLNLIPPVLIRAADRVRSVRNQFAHNLDYTSFAQLPDQKDSSWRRMRQFHDREFANTHLDSKVRPRSRAEIFHDVYFYCIAGLTSYHPSISLLRAEIAKPEFVQAIGGTLASREQEFWSRLMRETPLKTEIKDGRITKTYANDYVVTMDLDPDAIVAAEAPEQPQPATEGSSPMGSPGNGPK
jgi:hypothetical protein